MTSAPHRSGSAVAVELNRARQLVSVGRTHRAIAHLKDAVRARPDALALRRSLAELYRDLGYHDQAGRWGIVIDGWTTAIERDRLARLLASSGVARHDVATFLVLPTGTLADVPGLIALLDGPVASYRATHGYDLVVRSSSLCRRLGRLAAIGWASSFAAGVAWLVWDGIEPMFLPGDLSGLFAHAGWASLTLAGCALALNAAAAAADRRASWAISLGATALLMIIPSLDRLIA